MSYSNTRRGFLKAASITGVGIGLNGILPISSYAKHSSTAGKRVGIIGLDTSHSVAFARALNKEDASPVFAGYKIVAAYPQGSKDIVSSVERIPGYTEEVKKLGVKIVGSIAELLKETDVIMLETNDGRLHLEQVIPVFQAGKRVFIDKPIAASLSDAIKIFEASKKYKVPVFSASSLRYSNGLQELMRSDKLGKILGADAYSPMKIEKTHPDLFWYGIHGVETLFTIMGTGCEWVSRVSTDGSELVTGTWSDKRIGTFRGLMTGKQDYGATVFGEKGIDNIGKYSGYDPLLVEIIKFFESGIPPVPAEETLEIFAFMEAADQSKKNRGAAVSIKETFARASKR